MWTAVGQVVLTVVGVVRTAVGQAVLTVVGVVWTAVGQVVLTVVGVLWTAVGLTVVGKELGREIEAVVTTRELDVRVAVVLDCCEKSSEKHIINQSQCGIYYLITYHKESMS